ncbi:AfsR/SARP family transcriptional regulator [Kitasatospora azatica]|uniref:AfsR/SARP family transcriptional regulator n=1 Tax=Kitasatospora azatica TaxID=58347 RepID=UPI0009FD6565|nr:BTAD domain-containing putative transcriptional regulator [Kitasatospora azatica]
MSAGPEKPRSTFKILGSPEGWSAGARLHLGGPTQERVLVTLLLEPNRVVPLPRLVEAAWDETPPATAPHQIRKIIADLRRRLPDGAAVIRTDSSGYRAAVADDQLDLTLFTVRLHRAKQAVAAGLRSDAADQLRAALDLWRGPIMAGAGGAVIGAASAALQERRLTAAEQLIDIRLDLGEAADVVWDIQQLVREHPLCERLRARLMLALYRSGRPADALEEYSKVRKLLVEELGVDPGGELVSLHQRILRNSPELAAPPRADAAPSPVPTARVSPCSLPYDLPNFVGREEALRQLTESATISADRGTKIITIEGMGGSGKTALAVRAAHALAERYPDGQLAVDLRGFTPGQEPLEPEVVLDVLLRTMGVPGDRIPDGLLGRISLWRVTTAQRRLLILLDNAVNSAQVRPLLPSSPGCLVLVTSRVRMTDIDGSDAFPIGLLSPQESADLLERTLGADRVCAEPDAARELAQLCGYLPLGLQISVGRLINRPRWTIRYLVDRMRSETSRLEELSAGDRSVAVSLRLSYLAMEPCHQAAFRLLSIHPGQEVDVWTAAALLGVSADEAEESLEHLLDIHLIGQPEVGRYVFHDLVRSYAQSLRDEYPGTADETGAAVLRLMDYYARAVEAASETLYPGRVRFDTGLPRGTAELPGLGTVEAALFWFEQERRNLLSAVRLAQRSGLHRYAAWLPRNLGRYLQSQGHLTDSLDVGRIGVEAARMAGEPLLLRVALTNLSVALWYLCRFREGVEYLDQALELAVEIGDRRGEAVCLRGLGTFHNSLGDYAEGLRCLQLALSMHQELESPREAAETLVSISSATVVLGRYAEASVAASRSLVLNQQLGELHGQIRSLVNEANARLGLGESEAALMHLARAHELCRRLGTQSCTALVLVQLADAYRQVGRYSEAYETGSRALDLIWTAHSPASMSTVENVLGRIENARGEQAKALRRHQRAHRLASDIEFRLGMAEALEGMAAASAGLGDSAQAAKHSAAADELFALMGVPEHRRRPFRGLRRGMVSEAPGLDAPSCSIPGM